VCGFLGVIALTLTVSGVALAQRPAPPKPSPTPRRALPKAVAGSRGFEQFAKRDASARLIAAAGTRVVVDPGDHFSKGEAHYKGRQYEPAVKELREAVKQSPDWEDPHYVLALSLAELGKLKEAIEEYKQVIALAIKDDPKILSYYNMGNAYFTLNARPKALNFFTQAVDIYGGLPELAPDQHFYMGNALLHLGRSQGAITSYRKAVELRPSYAQAHLSLGLAYAAAGNKKAARDEYNTLKALDAARADRLLKVINTGR